MNLNEIEMVVFDMAGTTVAEGKTVYQSVATALQLIDLDLSRDEIFMAIGGMDKVEGIALIVKQYAPETTKEKLEEINQKFLKILNENYESSEEIAPFPGAEDLFKTLHKREIKVVLDTGYNRETVNLLLRKLGWDQRNLIDFTVASDEVSSGRPAPHMIEKAMAHCRISQASKVMKVGDTASDMLEGVHAGCKFVVGMESEMYDSEMLFKAGATHTIKNLLEIVNSPTSQV